MLAHYMNDKEYTHEVINGDIHTANQIAAGFGNKRWTLKSFIYAFIYGAGSKINGTISLEVMKEMEKELKKSFLEQLPSLRSLREKSGCNDVNQQKAQRTQSQRKNNS